MMMMRMTATRSWREKSGEWNMRRFDDIFYQELGTQNFFEREGRPYCEQDYHGLFSPRSASSSSSPISSWSSSSYPRCGYCQGPILDKCISALDQTFHPEHFFCSACGDQFGDDGFHEKDDAAFCKTCYFEQFAPKCGGCNTPITENYISSLNLQWHPNCFVCKECQMPFHDGNFFEHEGFPYCEQHYHALRGSLCAGCHKVLCQGWFSAAITWLWISLLHLRQSRAAVSLLCSVNSTQNTSCAGSISTFC